MKGEERCEFVWLLSSVINTVCLADLNLGGWHLHSSGVCFLVSNRETKNKLRASRRSLTLREDVVKGKKEGSWSVFFLKSRNLTLWSDKIVQHSKWRTLMFYGQSVDGILALRRSEWEREDGKCVTRAGERNRWETYRCFGTFCLCSHHCRQINTAGLDNPVKVRHHKKQ